MTTTESTGSVWVVADGSKHVKARVTVSADMDETPGQLLLHFGDDWRIRVTAYDDGLTADEAKELADILNKAADWLNCHDEIRQ